MNEFVRASIVNYNNHINDMISILEQAKIDKDGDVNLKLIDTNRKLINSCKKSFDIIGSDLDTIYENYTVELEEIVRKED